MNDPEKREPPETVEEVAVCVVDLFDQANTGAAIEEMGSRGQSLSKAVDKLRRVLNQDGQKTILNDQEIFQVREDRTKTMERYKKWVETSRD